MTTDSENSYTKYIKQYLLHEILSKLQNETMVDFQIEHSGGLDGFMSALYNIKLSTTTSNGLKERNLIVKFMKGDVAFRESSKSYIQFANEIYVYDKILPFYAEILKNANLKFQIEDWVPTTYVAKYGYVEGLSKDVNDFESVLVMENLKSLGYANGPRLYLNRDHLLKMCKPLAQYHALTYALRIRNEAELEHLKSGIKPLPFISDDDDDEKNNFYRVLYRIAFDRLFDFFDRMIDGNTFNRMNANDLQLIQQLRNLREKYFEEPVNLLERFRTAIDTNEEDRKFGVILHGDFNRNNVLFKHKETENESSEELGEVEDVKLIDFQELRYGTPAIDLSFFMYFNTPEEMRDEIWMDILKEYHMHMYDTLKSVVQAENSDGIDKQDIESKLEFYKFENFLKHFSRYAFYGVMICIQFMPWILCNEAECELLSKLFETDMYGDEFRKISMEAGGDDVNLKILNVIRHASKMGYMDYI